MKKFILLLLSFLILSTISCSKDMRKSQSVMDDPQMHISRGMKYFNSGDYKNAKKEFEDAIRIKWDKDADKAEAYAGLGMYYAVKGDKSKAYDNAKEAKSLNKKSPLVFTCYGRTISYLNKGKDGDWWEDAFDKFDKAIELADEKRDNQALAEAYYFKGMAAKDAYKFSKAKKAFAKAVELKTVYADEANKQWEIVQMIERAKPGTRVGAKVALMDKVGKAEIAVLFVEELKIDQILAKREKKTYDNEFKAPDDPMKYNNGEKSEELATDIKGHWAESWINDVLKLGVMEDGPDHKFYPDKKITRAEYAMMLLKVMVLITGDESLYTKYFGEPNSMFVDVRTDHAAYNAMAVCASRGIMKANLNGEFQPAKTVSGAEALLIIREFQNALRINF